MDSVPGSRHLTVAFECTTLENFLIYVDLVIISFFKIIRSLHELKPLNLHVSLRMTGSYFIMLTCHYRWDFFLTMICDINIFLYVLNNKVTSRFFLRYVFSNTTFQINFSIESYIICFLGEEPLATCSIHKTTAAQVMPSTGTLA